MAYIVTNNDDVNVFLFKYKCLPRNRKLEGLYHIKKDWSSISPHLRLSNIMSLGQSTKSWLRECLLRLDQLFNDSGLITQALVYSEVVKFNVGMQGSWCSYLPAFIRLSGILDRGISNTAERSFFLPVLNWMLAWLLGQFSIGIQSDNSKVFV